MGVINMGFWNRGVCLPTICLVLGFTMSAHDLPGEWSGNYSPCDRHEEVLKHEHMNLGVRFNASDPGLVDAFFHALDFWATVLDMEWHEEDSRACSIEIVDGNRGLFRPGEVARAQFPGGQFFQGWIAVNRTVALQDSEQYFVAVHELGHLMGLRHNPSARSVMYYLNLDGPLLLDSADLGALTVLHKLRSERMTVPVIVAAPPFETRTEDLWDTHQAQKAQPH
jgi:hypothetical protein